MADVNAPLEPAKVRSALSAIGEAFGSLGRTVLTEGTTAEIFTARQAIDNAVGLPEAGPDDLQQNGA